MEETKSMNSAEIEQAILSVSSPLWKKVAMIIAMAAKKLGVDNEQGYDLVANRLEALVSDGRLVAQGNITNWRFSEVRLPETTTKQEHGGH